jgi:hypothetical protein
MKSPGNKLVRIAWQKSVQPITDKTPPYPQEAQLSVPYVVVHRQPIRFINDDLRLDSTRGKTRYQGTRAGSCHWHLRQVIVKLQVLNCPQLPKEVNSSSRKADKQRVLCSQSAHLAGYLNRRR